MQARLFIKNNMRHNMSNYINTHMHDHILSILNFPIKFKLSIKMNTRHVSYFSTYRHAYSDQFPAPDSSLLQMVQLGLVRKKKSNVTSFKYFF